MKCLVTGGCGFIGSTLVDRLHDDKHEVTVIDDMSTGQYAWNNPYIKDYHIASIQDAEKLCENETFDVIFHLAAISAIQPSFENIPKTHFVNAQCTATLLDYARKINSKFIFASTCALVGGNSSPYALSKRIGEEYCRYYKEYCGLKTVILRLFNVYGHRDTKGVIYKFSDLRYKNQHLTITGDGEQRRDFVDVQDVVEAFIRAVDVDEVGPFDVCRGKTFSINEVADLVCSAAHHHIPERPGEQYTFYETEPSLPGWTPTRNLEDYLRR